MTDKKVYRLEQSKTFCMAPWVHIHNLPSGEILPCCINNQTLKIGNLYEDSVETIWNNDVYKSIRTDMLADTPIASCERCYKEEEWGNNQSYRKVFNNEYGNRYEDLVEQSTTEDGTATKMEFRRWDFRFSNLCNLACTSCGPNCSSMWVEIVNKMGLPHKGDKFQTSRQNLELFIDTIKKQADIVDNVYLAGGEPLIQPEHYEILKHIDEIGRLDKINFTYSTNLTSLTYKSTNVMDYWNKMKYVKVLVSLDEVDPDRLYYIRYPSKASEIIDNIKTLNKNFTGDNRRWSITPTWSIMNIHRIKDIASFFKDNNLLPATFADSAEWEVDLHNILLLYPNHMSISAAPPEWKQYLRKQLDEYVQWYIDEMLSMKNSHVKQRATDLFLSNIKRFYGALDDNIQVDPKIHKDWYSRLDRVRNTNFSEAFPELAWNLV